MNKKLIQTIFFQDSEWFIAFVSYMLFAFMQNLHILYIKNVYIGQNRKKILQKM